MAWFEILTVMLLTAGMRATWGWILGDAYLLSNMMDG
jgi:hypothetical protein